MAKCDFCGWATKNDLKCSDGRIIRKGAFKHNDGQTVPLVWMHQHDNPYNVIGHALLENREEGVYAHCSFNNSENALAAKEAVLHGDIKALSIYANRLKQNGPDVIHGEIREVSLVYAGANPGAFIETVLAHADGGVRSLGEDEMVLHTGECFELYHEEEPVDALVHAGEKEKEESEVAGESSEKTVQQVYDDMTEEQKAVTQILIGMAVEEVKAEHSDSEGGDEMKHNLFDGQLEAGDTLSHAEMMEIIADAKRFGSLKESALQHGIEQIDYLYPFGEGDGKNVTNTPIFIQRDMGWVKKVMGSVHHTPFSRIKSILANITEDDARARGYIKGQFKKEEVFKLLKRSTTPQTVYKKQKLDRDDVIDITDFDVVAWLKAEMRMMLDEELARAILVGDGRDDSSDDKISELNIRPVWKDEDLFTIKAPVKVAASASDEDVAKAVIKAAIKARKNYKGSGNPVAYMTEDLLTSCLLIEDATGRTIYEDETKLAKKLRVSEIVTVPVMEGLTRQDDEGTTFELQCLIVNLHDYNVGADKGGAVNMFDDFDIDYNAQKYLIETRCSGALIKPFAAIAVELDKTNAAG